MNGRVNRILDLMEGMTLVEFAELTNALKERFDIKSSISISVKTDSNDMNPEPRQPPVDTYPNHGNYYDVYLTGYNNKIAAIKLVRELVATGLKEAKDIVEACDHAPQLIKRGVFRSEADYIEKRFQENTHSGRPAGTVEIR